jgi:hypothetical protein
MSTTYLTSTLTGVLTALAIRRWPQEWQRGTGVLIAIVIGAKWRKLAPPGLAGGRGWPADPLLRPDQLG